jgi:hypothetical protein
MIFAAEIHRGGDMFHFFPDVLEPVDGFTFGISPTMAIE